MNKPLVMLLTFGTGGDLQSFLMLSAGRLRKSPPSVEYATWLPTKG